MWTCRFLRRVQRSLKIHGKPSTCNNLQRREIFSTPLLFYDQKPIKRKEYYPTEKIKTMEDFEKYASAHEKHHMEKIRAEYNFFCRDGKLELFDPTDKEWLILMNFESKKSRLGHLRGKDRSLKKKQAVLETPKETKEERNRDERLDLNSHHRFYRAIYNYTFNLITEYRVAQAAMFEDPIVIDFSFVDDLYYNEIWALADQYVQLISAVNASSHERTPTLNLIFCNLKHPLDDNELVKVLDAKSYDRRNFETCPVTITEKSYLDLFPKKDLVFLTPDAKHYFHPSDGIPIVGGIVDLTTHDKLSYMRATEEGIKTRKLPIDMVTKVYGNKALALMHVVEYINILRSTGDPYEAYKVLPLRKRRKPPKLRNVEPRRW